MPKYKFNKKEIVKPVYFANWSDLWGFPLAYKLLPFITRFDFITPNMVTFTAFILYTIGSFSLFITYPNHLLVSVVLLPLAFVLDDLDGQLARVTKKYSIIGDYLDKVLDVLKIYIITLSLGVSVYLTTHKGYYLVLALTACFFFNYRYYIKLETMFSILSRDSSYLDKSSKQKDKKEKELTQYYSHLSKTTIGKIKSFLLKNKTIFAVDEAEFAVFTALGALFNRLDITLWILAVSQIVISMYRFFERGNQLVNKSDSLLNPMRK